MDVNKIPTTVPDPPRPHSMCTSAAGATGNRVPQPIFILPALCVLRDVIATVYSVMSAGHVYSVMSLTVYSVV